MTVYEYVIAREANRLMKKSERRRLTDEELELLDVLLPTVERLAREECRD